GPYHGGTHLPDMTVVTPVFVGGQAQPDFFVASRAHHADIGGMTPGSMPPFSRAIEEEGALFECFALVSAGTLRESELRAALTAGPWPARRPEQNLADLRAQLAANARGVYGGGAVRVPYADRVADSPERGMPRAAGDRHSRRIAPRPAPSRGGGGRERGDLTVHRRCAVRSAGNSRRFPGNHEQPDLRGCAPAVLRDHRRWRRRGGGLRRLRRGADSHDQLAPHRPGDPRERVPGAGAGVRDPPRLGWRRTAPWRRWHRAAAGVSCP